MYSMRQKKIKGERLETENFNENTSEHLHRYALASFLSENKVVLDIACGEGYGSNLIARKAKQVVGVDIDVVTIGLAQKKYTAPNLEFKVGSAAEIPCNDKFFDMVFSFETLEHHDKHTQMMQEIKRVLKPSGICIVSTPDKLVYSDKKKYQNPFHIKELYKEEFRTLMAVHFKNVVFLKQRFIAGSLITPDIFSKTTLTGFEGNFNKIERIETLEAEYLIGVASDENIPLFETSIFIDEDFAKNKVIEFQQNSLRYKLGNTILKPVKYFKKSFLGKS